MPPLLEADAEPTSRRQQAMRDETIFMMMILVNCDDGAEVLERGASKCKQPVQQLSDRNTYIELN